MEGRRLLAASLSLNGTQFPTPAAEINVSSDATNGQSEMLIAINPTNPLNIVGFSHRLTSPITLDVYRSIDGGSTWATTQIDNSDDGRGVTGNRYDPALAFDNNGLLYLVYGYRGTTPDQLIAATSSDGGANFGNFQVIDSQNGFTSMAGNNLPGVDRWSITTGTDGASTTQAAVIAYTQNAQEGTSTDQRIAILGTRDGGANWTAPLVINDGSISGADAGNLAASPTIGLGGELSVAWYDGGTSILFDTDRNGLWGAGFNFGTDRTVRNAPGLVNITPPAQPERGIGVSPVLASNVFNGHIYIAFQERFGASTGNDTDIYFGRSTDSGVSWNIVSVESSTGTDFHPMMAVDRQSNAIGIAYYSTDGDQTTGNDDVRMRLALSSDFGNTWSKSNIGAQTSNEAGGYTGDYLEYTGLALRDGTAHVLWASRYAGAGGVVGTDLDAFAARVSFDSSSNNNILRIGSSGPLNNNFVVRRSAENANYVEVFTDGVRDYTGLAASIDSITFESNGGIDSYAFDNLPAIPISILGSTGADTFNINSLSGASLLTISSGNGDDVVRLGGGTINVAAIASPVVFNGGDGNDTLYLGSPGSGNADSVVANVTFNGEGTPGGLGNRVIYNDQEAQYQVSYNIGPSAITRQGFFSPRTVTYSNTSRIVVNAGSDSDLFTVGGGISPNVELYGNNGHDNFVVGGGNMNLLAGAIYNGGNGTDQITYDDHLRATGVIWDIHPTVVNYGGIIPLSTTGFEAVGVLAGNGNDQIYFYNDIGGKIINVDAGGGNDLVDTNHARALSLNIAGGDGIDLLEIDDIGIPTGTLFQYAVYPNLVTRYDFIAEYHVGHSGFESLDLYLPAQENEVYVVGVASGMRIFGNSSSDSFTVDPRDGNGNLTINGNFLIVPGGGTDDLLVDDAASTLPINYAFTNVLGSTTDGHLFGMGTGFMGFANSLELLTVNAGSGDDTFAINSFKNGTALAINGGFGDDTVNWTPASNNLANITSMASFNYNGGDGTDAMYVYNGSSTSVYGYWAFLGGFTAFSTVSLTMSHANIEYISAIAGSAGDSFQLFGTTPGVFIELTGQGGNDLYQFGSIFTVTLQGIVSPVKINGAGGADRIELLNPDDNGGRIYHVTQNSVGAVPGDNLFPVGGSLEFNGVAGELLIRNGNGADTVYAQANALTPLTIHGGNPTTTPGDKLDVNFAGGENPVFTPGAAGAGTYTFSNYQPLNYTGFESVVAAYPGDFNRNGTVGPSDFDFWKSAFGTNVVPNSGGDGNGNGVLDAADYVIWRKNVGKSFPGIGSAAEDGGGAAAVETLGDSRLGERPAIIAADSSVLTPTRQVGRTRHWGRQSAAGEGLELESSQDRALMAWIAQSAIFSIADSAFGQSDTAHPAGFHEGHIESLELALVELGDRALANGLAQLRALL